LIPGVVLFNLTLYFFSDKGFLSIGGLGKSSSTGAISPSSNNKSGTMTVEGRYWLPPDINGEVIAGAR
jgi:hypothetical protein